MFTPKKIDAQNLPTYKELKGKVIDAKTNKTLSFSDLIVDGSNISTITNSDGEFLLKVNSNLLDRDIVITHLGYEKKNIKISELNHHTKILLIPAVTELNAISINPKKENARSMVLEVLKNKSMHNTDGKIMTAFYRETIKKRRKNASLSEAVVQIHKQPINSLKREGIDLIKARKSTDYSKLDTLALKLQGGPFSNLYTDVVKYTDYVFNKENMDMYTFSFDAPTKINNNTVYVINFKQTSFIKTPLYYGKLYVDAKTLALTSAIFSLNVSNKELSSKMYIRRKPKKVDVYPTKASYRVNYRTQNGKWHYAYSNILLTFKVNWKGKLFNSTYTLNSEMAITDWKHSNAKYAKTKNTMLRPTTILTDKASGFSDPEFWGKYNIIEPEKSIETAIAKIKRQLKRT
ncbi:carboxypeptidase-like regulatory domain-containing protein [Postechiella marina]|uniref:Carboxypeptidase-like regulatory domain-containing protein n=2 Tax=Postechiella marina TaxID=943941 RepID=A0ABP8CHN9_9FLAO